MAKDYVGPIEDNTEPFPQPVLLYRAPGVLSLAEATAEEALQTAIRHFVPPISEEEAAAFGVPPFTVGEEIQRGIGEANRLYRELTVAPVSPRPEVAPAEDDSFTTERFGAEDGSAQNSIPVHPQFMPTAPVPSVAAIRPRMRRR